MIHNQAETLGEFRSTRKHRRDGILEPVGWDVLSALHSFFRERAVLKGHGFRFWLLESQRPSALNRWCKILAGKWIV